MDCGELKGRLGLLEACSGKEAFYLLSKHRGIGVLVVDHSMSNGGGRWLMDSLYKQNPKQSKLMDVFIRCTEKQFGFNRLWEGCGGSVVVEACGRSCLRQDCFSEFYN